MIAVITGDIINSTKYKNPDTWLQPLKESLNKIETNKKKWEIYRGDSFQLEVTDIYQGVINCIYIKACIKTIKGLDVRLAIGIGNKTFEGDKISESNGDAFTKSGNLLEILKQRKNNLMMSTGNTSLDGELNLYFKLISLLMDNWTINSAEIVKFHLESPAKIQQEIAEIIGISQDAVSKRLKRSNLEVILEVNDHFKKRLAQNIMQL